MEEKTTKPEKSLSAKSKGKSDLINFIPPLYIE